MFKNRKLFQVPVKSGQTPRLRFLVLSAFLFVTGAGFWAVTARLQTTETRAVNLVTENGSNSESERLARLKPSLSDSGSLPDETPHTLVGSFYTVENGFTSTLLLNNKGGTVLEVTPTLYGSDGQTLELPTVKVGASRGRMVNMQDWIQIGGDAFRTGSLRLFHRGKDLVLGAQIYLENREQSLTFEEKLAELGKFNSTRQETVWWMPSDETTAKLVLTNTSAETLTVTARASKGNGGEQSREFTLAAHETRLLNMSEDFNLHSPFYANQVFGLSLEHCGGADWLQARVLISDDGRGYSNFASFSNPAGGKSSGYEGVGLHVNQIESIALAPVIAARNTGAVVSRVRGVVPYTRGDGTKGSLELPTLKLRPGQMQLFDVSALATRAAAENISLASLELKYNTVPGSIVAAAHSQSVDGNQVFRVPLWDALGQRSPTGGYPFRIDAASTTLSYIKSAVDYEEDYFAYLMYGDNEAYLIGRKPIAGRETVEIDVRKLRDEQIPDSEGRVIPLEVSTGQLQWTLMRKDELPDDDREANLALLGRSEQIDLINGLASNYACQNCCGSTSADSFILPSSPIEAEYNGVNSVYNLVAFETMTTCYGIGVPYPRVEATWISSNPQVATVDGGGTVRAVAAGETSIRAEWQGNLAYMTQPCFPGEFSALSEGCLGEEAVQTSRLKIFKNPPESVNPSPNGYRRGGPSAAQSEMVSSAPESALEPVIMTPGCGQCQHRFVPRTTNSVTYAVRPRLTINPAQTRKDGENASFSVSVQGGTAQSYQWRFTAPGGAGNNPDVPFTSPTAANTDALAKWFALPNDPCTASIDSTYRVKVKVYVNNNDYDKETDLTVNAFWDPAGYVAPADITGGPSYGFNTLTGLWVVTGKGSLQRVSHNAVIYVPTTSQFYNKTLRHEQKHEQQWATGLLANNLTVNGMMAVLSPLTDATEQGLINKINVAAVTYYNQQGASYTALLPTLEREAYNISDVLAPQYLYQNCGRF